MKNCQEENCDGILEEEGTGIELPRGCRHFDFAFPCNKCGRLHWADGDPIFDRRDNRIFLDRGCLVRKDSEGGIVSVDVLRNGNARPFPSPMSKNYG